MVQRIDKEAACFFSSLVGLGFWDPLWPIGWSGMGTKYASSTTLARAILRAWMNECSSPAAM